MERLGLPVPSRRSLYNKIAYIRRTLTQYSSEFSTKDLRGWAETLNGSTSEDEAFVIGSTIDDSAGEDGIPNFQVTVSTRRLVKLLDRSGPWPLHVDGTYKLTWQGFPVLISGITDAQHRFHPVSLSLVSHERTSAYLHLFTALKDAYAQETGRDLDPLFVIADGSAAITAAVTTAFPGCPRGMCWAHVVRNVDKNLLGVRNEERRKRFRRDFHLFQLATSPREFRDAWGLFKAHYTPNRELAVVVPYIQETWIDFGLGNWFEGFQKGFPSTNNGLERANRSLKDDYTMHVKLGLAQFLQKMEEAISHWSRRERREPFIDRKAHSLAEWTSAWQWKSLNLPRRRIMSRTSREAYLTAAKGDPQDFQQHCTEYMERSRRGFRSWNDYLFYRQCIWMVMRRSTGWVCTCPEEAKTVPIGRKRKRGRPSRVAGPLVRDDGC